MRTKSRSRGRRGRGGGGRGAFEPARGPTPSSGAGAERESRSAPITARRPLPRRRARRAPRLPPPRPRRRVDRVFSRVLYSRLRGALAQLGERKAGSLEVGGSIPPRSTIILPQKLIDWMAVDRPLAVLGRAEVA